MATAPAAQAARNSVRAQARPNCRFWAQDRTDLVPCPDWALRRIPANAPEVLDMLSKHEQFTVRVNYSQLCGVLGLTRPQVKRCMLALRATGLVEFRVRTERVIAEDQGQAGWVEGFRSCSWVRPLASCDRRKDGTLQLYVSEGFLSMAEKRNTRGGRRPGAGRPKKSNGPPVSENRAHNSPNTGAGKESNGPPLHEHCVTGDPICDPPGRGAPCGASPTRRAFSPDGVGPQHPGNPDQAGPTSRRFAGGPGAGATPASPAGRERLPIPMAERGPAPRIPAFDTPAVKWEGLRLRVPEMPSRDEIAAAVASGDHEMAGRWRERRVEVVVAGYNHAVRAVYGADAKRFVRKDLTRSKLYGALSAAADVMCEHDVPPGEWAEWRLRYLLGKGVAEPAFIGQVMNAKTVAKMRGFFRSTAKVDAQPKQDYQRWHYEQMFRAAEAQRRWEWGDEPDGRTAVAATPWYYEMRRAERARGELDPLLNWPSPKNDPTGKRGGGSTR